MNTRTTINCCLLLLALVVPRTASAQGARLRLDHLNKLAEKAQEAVDVTVDAAMLKATAGFLAGKGADTAKVQEMLQGITGIYVKSYQFGAPNAYAESDIEAVRKQVTGPEWSRVVGVRGKGELTEIYLWKEHDTNGGLVIIAAEPNELTIVNIVGRVDLASLGALGPMIPKMPGAMRKGMPR
ncbi:MAG: DUF4252 domain-containing protein [Vicinamibacterales bacterium]